MKHETRETWLRDAFERLLPTVLKAVPGTKLNPKLEIYVSWPYRSKTAGGMWLPKTFDKAGKAEHILLSPVLGLDRVLDVLLHEMLHAALPGVNGHGGLFKKAGLAAGLEGNMRSSHAGKELAVFLAKVAKDLGPYPHVVCIDARPKAKPSASKSIVRFVSPVDSAYSAWVSPKQAEEHGPPICPISKRPMEPV